MEIVDARFVKSAVWAKDYPTIRNDHGKELPEIAVAGRSNVGKSSLLNNLFRRKNLVKTSSTPGKTQLINFFAADDQFAFVDLPGYGFAKVPDGVRSDWGPMMEEYFESRKMLKVLLLLFDIRRLPTEEDFLLVDWAEKRDLPWILVLTKTDKVKANEKHAQTLRLLHAFKCERAIHYSSVKNLGRKELLAELEKVLS